MKIEKAINLSLQNVLKEGLTDIFPPPAEILLLKNKLFQKKIRELVNKCINGNSLESLEVNQIEHVLRPKGGPFDFRRCALIQPLDTIKYLSLILLFADQIENHRPKKANKIVFSYRFKPNKGYLFDSKYNITSFNKYISQKIRQKDNKILVTCDIANYYDRLNLHRLESILLSLGIDKVKVKQLNALLLFWANRDSYALPVGSNASRILAEAALIEVDNYLLSIGVKFCRFVDDYRLFAPNAHTAHYWLTQLIERLWLEGLTINQRKTKIEDISQLLKSKEEGQQSKEIDKKKASVKKAELQPQFRLMAGYGGAIPTRFRAPKTAELEKLKDSDPKKIYATITKKKIVEPDDITHFIKCVIGTEKYHSFILLPDLADLFPQFTPYIIDVLIKNKDKITSADKRTIQERFSTRLKRSTYLPEYLTIAIVQLLGCEDYQDKETLIDMFRQLRRNAGAYIGRSLLDSLENLVLRNEVLEIRKYFSRADAWEKRQIVRIVDKHLSEDEKDAFLKNVRIQESRDIFLVEYIKPSAKKIKKKKTGEQKASLDRRVAPGAQ